MPSKKKAGSATANNQRPRPVSQTSAPSTNHTTSSSTNVEALSSTPPVRQEVRISDTAEQVEPPGPSEENDPPTGTVNRKKQKRRQKQAAKLAEQQQQHLNSGLQAMNGQSGNGHIPYPGRGPQKGYFTEEPDYLDGDYVDESGEVEEAFYSGDDQDIGELRHSIQDASKKKKKKKNKKTSQLLDEVRETSMVAASLLGRRALATQQALAHAKVDMRSPQQKKRDQIWNDSKNQERENIKRFWLELGEDERKSLVQVEKEAVLKKMKEQKSPCNCTICGRKRSAIEEELENLYDAYYKELEQYVHPNDAAQARRLMPPPHPRAPSLSQTHSYPSHLPPGHFGDPEDEDDDEEYDDDFDEEEEDELYSDDELEEIPRMPEEFYNFSQSLRVKDGILTVADDLLKNDGKEFINMMDKLADRRMQREQEARFPQTTLSQSHHGHNHAPIEDDDYDDEEDDEDDEDYDSQDLEEEDDDVDALTEEQRMEEGRRMFQVFAARMFEQRVMTAYREKVARERQQKLIEELDEESRLDTQREAKRQREAAKKKEKKRLQKLAKEEEKARKDAEKAAQEAEVRAAEEKRLEEQRHRREEQRKKREAEKKAQEEERAKKEADRQKRLQQERERHQEAERKQREAKDREKKKREEARKKEREEREAKEREVRERKLKEERDRKAQEEESRKQTETVSKLNRNERDRSKENEQQQSRRPPIAIPPGLYPQHSAPVQSPAFTVATPIIPKAPTPARPRQTSQQGQQSLGSSPRSQQAVTETSRNSVSPASGTASQTPVSSTASGKPSNQLPPQHHHHHPQPSAPLHHPQPSAPLSPLSQPGRQNFPFGYGMPMGPGHPPPPGMAPNMMPQMPMYQGPPMGGQYRGFGFPNNAPFPPGINGNRPYPQRQGNMPFTSQPPPMSMPQNTMGKDAPVRGSGHSRQPSASYDRPQDAPSQPQPISRPAPIGRPSSTTPDKKNKRKSADPEVEHLATQLGSKALLDDSDLPLGSSSPNDQSRISNLAPGTGRVPSFSGFNDHLQKHDTFHLGPGTPQANTWAFGTSPGGSSTWGPSPPGMAPNMNSGWPGAAPNGPAPNAFGMGGGLRAHHASRPVTIRMMAAQACRQLSNSTGSPSSGYYPIQAILSQISQMKPVNEAPVLMNEILEILDTEGNHQNGGGSFTVRGDGPAAEVKFDADDTSTTSPANAGGIGMGMAPGGPPGGARGSIVGDIGSPIIGGHNSLHHPHSMAPFGGTIGNRF